MLTVICGAAPAASLEPTAGVTRSQSPPDVVSAAAFQAKTPTPGFITPNDCGGTTPPPCTAVKLSPDCVSIRACDWALTVIVAGRVTASPVSVSIVTDPVYVPAPRPAGS